MSVGTVVEAALAGVSVEGAAAGGLMEDGGGRVEARSRFPSLLLDPGPAFTTLLPPDGLEDETPGRW